MERIARSGISGSPDLRYAKTGRGSGLGGEAQAEGDENDAGDAIDPAADRAGQREQGQVVQRRQRDENQAPAGCVTAGAPVRRDAQTAPS